MGFVSPWHVLILLAFFLPILVVLYGVIKLPAAVRAIERSLRRDNDSAG